MFLQQIEVKMEEFKVLEKDLKTKAYSREGLEREEKLDPQELLREEKKEWVQGILSQMQSAVELMEGDLDKLSNSKPKSKYKDKVNFISRSIRVPLSKHHALRLKSWRLVL